MHTDFALRTKQIDFSLEVKLRRCYAYGPFKYGWRKIEETVQDRDG